MTPGEDRRIPKREKSYFLVSRACELLRTPYARSSENSSLPRTRVNRGERQSGVYSDRPGYTARVSGQASSRHRCARWIRSAKGHGMRRDGRRKVERLEANRIGAVACA